MTRTIVSELATPAEAAQELRVSVGTVKRWLRDGELNGVRLPSGHWRIPLSELRAMRVHANTNDRRPDQRPVGMHQ